MELELRNVGIIKSAHLEFIQGLNLIVGSSSSGKSTLLRAIRCMMDNSFSDSNITYGQKKMAIRMVYNDHSATYVRDLDKPQRKSAYQIDGKVYTKLGRTSLDDLSAIFKLAPVEIDGEKINFNFSAQFSGPFLLLGSPSLLYSILTYRSSFDITKINDLYYTDLKKIKQDTSVLLKTKESLDKEKENKEKELDKLKDFPSVFIRVQKIKQQYESLNKERETLKNYKDILSKIDTSKLKLRHIEESLNSFTGYSDKLASFTALNKYVSISTQIDHIENKNKLLSKVLLNIADVIPEYEYIRLLKGYITCNKKYKKNDTLLSSISIPNIEIIKHLKGFIDLNKQVIKNKESIQNIDFKLNEVTLRIKEVGVCPLCNQPICNC